MSEEPRPIEYIHRVLVVDDDYRLAELLREVLTYENCAVDVAANGMEAQETLRRADYDAVICDLMMPRLDGEALYNEVVKLFPDLSGRFIFMTSQATRRAGFTDFVFRTGNTLLEKPFEIEQLRSALEDLLQR
jgi:DNA-binding response OmpR family regulator